MLSKCMFDALSKIINSYEVERNKKEFDVGDELTCKFDCV